MMISRPLPAPTACLAQGLRRAWRRPGLILLVYLASTIPALLGAWQVSPSLETGLDHSTFAQRHLPDDPAPVLLDWAGANFQALRSLARWIAPSWLLLNLGQIVLTAGLVAALGQRPNDLPDRPVSAVFLEGVATTTWVFVRSAVWFLLTLGICALLFAILAPWLGARAFATAGASGELLALLLVALVAYGLFATLDLAHDLGRLALGRHRHGRATRCLGQSLAHVARHPLRPLSLHAVLGVASLTPLLVFLALGPEGRPASLWGLILLQQGVILAGAGLRIVRWATLGAYYDRLGAPAWGAATEPSGDAPDTLEPQAGSAP